MRWSVIYVVSGFMRTGTSMMMKALEAGGLDAAYQQSRDVMKNRYADEHYDPNIGGLYELERKDYKDRNFPMKYEGKLIKALNMGIPRMSVMLGGIRVVFMRRDPEEIRQSYDAFFGKQLNPSNFQLNLNCNDYYNSYPITHFDCNMRKIKEQINNRKDVVSFEEFWFRDVVENPIKHFQILKDSGWPINIDKAIEVVDSKYCRFRLENLTVGIM